MFMCWLSRLLLIVSSLGWIGLCVSPAVQATSTTYVLVGVPIWANATSYAPTTALFRTNFDLAADGVGAELAIIADTRYEAWIDGRWIGRGPARFSRVEQEYDIHSLGTLATGRHTIAVLVRYDPDGRRSEDLGGGLQASIVANVAGNHRVVAQTSAQWRAMIATAWNQRAAWISNLGLIGHQELLDFRSLPINWQQPSFDDQTWALASVLEPRFTNPVPRSIPLLIDTPHTPTVIDSGWLSPGWQMIEFQHPTGNGESVQQTINLNAAAATSMQIEALDTAAVALDGATLNYWQPLADPRRPDVQRLDNSLAVGAHTLMVEVPVTGHTMALNTQSGVTVSNMPFSQSSNPGRRMLLANPVTTPASDITITPSDTGSTITIHAAATPRYIVLDLGRVHHGRINAIVQGMVGTIIDIGWDERMYNGRSLPAPGSLHHNLWQQVDSWVLDGTPRHLTTIDARAGRYVLIQIWGTGTVVFNDLHVREEHYPVVQRGSFESSDATLNQIWQVGVDTLVPNMIDAYADPWRERGQWWGDAMADFYINRVAFGDMVLLRRGLRQMADTMDSDGRMSPFAPAHNDHSIMLDYQMLWIEGLYQYWTLTGDTSLVVELDATLQRCLTFLHSYEQPDGLLFVPLGRHWSQSALIDWSGWSSRDGASTALNAQYAAVLRWAALLSSGQGKDDQAADYRARSERVSNAITSLLYLSDVEGYTASLLPSGPRSPRAQAQAWALIYSVVPEHQRPMVTAALLDQLDPFFLTSGYAVVEIYGLRWVFDALAANHRTDAALHLMRQQYGRLLTKGATTWWEGFRSDAYYDSSLSHGWGGSPTWFLSTYVLGAQQIGLHTWQIAPQPGNLTYARGSIPFGDATLSVDWQQPQCGNFDMAWTAPTGTRGTLILPSAPPSTRIWFDATLVWQNGAVGGFPIMATADGWHIEGLTDGTHVVKMQYTCRQVFLPLVKE